MLDPKIIKEDSQRVREMLRARSLEFDLDGLIESDKKRRDLIIKTDELRKEKNNIASEIAQKKKEKMDISIILDKMKSISKELAELEYLQEETRKKYDRLSLTVPNLIHDSVPIGVDDTANKEIRKWGKVPEFNFKINDHIDISENLDLVDLERAAKVSGARFYYLKNDLVRLNQSLIHYALDFLSEKNYSLVQPPYMINRKSMEGAIIAEDFE
ncbi:MAG: serine--tRNA ligase, partial [Nitrosarchaeum sp.]|nr:serine--tRNA ligase [Nitrosarchaeum sp.]